MTAEASWQIANPFPIQGASTIETGTYEQARELAVQPTLFVPAVGQLRRLATVYTERFGISDGPRGQILMLRGEHGSGKTHALADLMTHLSFDERRRSPRLRDVLQLYVKAEGPDLVNVYRRLMAQLSVTQLREMAVRFFGAVTAETMTGDQAGSEQANEAKARLTEEPALAHELLDRYAVDASLVLERRDAQLDALTEHSRDFRHVFAYLDDDELGDAAYRWFTASPIDQSDLRRLGASGPIDSPERVKGGLQLLAAMCSRVGIALGIYIDQYEKLVLAEDGPIPGNIGILHSLVEAIPRQDAMLLLCGNDQAWEALPPDLQARFGYNIVVTRGLDLVESVALIELYLHPREQADIPGDLPNEALLEPFTYQTLRLAHAETRGNPRALLQLCHALIEEACADRGFVDAEVLERAVRRTGERPLDPEDVLEVVAGRARAHGFAVERHDSGSLRLGLEEGVRFVVLLGQATHYYEEVLDAREQLQAFAEVRERFPAARVVVVVLGYDSREVRESLERVGIDVLAYRPETFRTRFDALLERAAPAAVESAAVASRVAAANRSLDERQMQAEADRRALTERTIALADSVDAQEIARRWETATTDWAVERRSIEQRIREARAQRREHELGELARLRAAAEVERRRLQRLLQGTLLVGIALLATGAGAAAYAVGGLFVVALGFVLTAGGLLSLYFILLRSGLWGVRDALRLPGILRELSADVTSVEDLRRLAYRMRERPVRLRFLMRHENPQVRYVASVSARKEDLEAVARALPGERSSIVRRAYAQRLGRELEDPGSALAEALTSRTGEAVYIWEGMVSREIAAGAPVPLHMEVLGWLSHARHLAHASRALYGALGSSPPEEVDRAFRLGLPLSERPALLELPIEVVRKVATAISPFEDGGLGTYDELARIADIDQAFVSLSHVLFLSELGLLVASPA